MTGKLVGIAIMISALVAGIGLYYLQVYGFYEAVETGEVQLVSVVSGEPETILFEDFQAIDADSSPIRYRACFSTEMSIALLTETYETLDNVDPRNAPHWFDCFDAEAIAADLEAGAAILFLGQKNIHFGVDRVVAVHEDGRGWIWHELNDCGEKAYDGTVVGEDCPDREEAN